MRQSKRTLRDVLAEVKDLEVEIYHNKTPRGFNND